MKLLSNVLIPNYLPDIAKTEEARKSAEARVQDVVITKQKGEVIVREGELVTRESSKYSRSSDTAERVLTYLDLLEFFC